METFFYKDLEHRRQHAEGTPLWIDHVTHSSTEDTVGCRGIQLGCAHLAPCRWVECTSHAYLPVVVRVVWLVVRVRRVSHLCDHVAKRVTVPKKC